MFLGKYSLTTEKKECTCDLWEMCFSIHCMILCFVLATAVDCSWMTKKICISAFSRCGHSPVYRSREMSGRALVPFVMVNEVPHTVLSLLEGLPDSTSPSIRQNNIHGTLLQVSFWGFVGCFLLWGFCWIFLVILHSQITCSELRWMFTRCQHIGRLVLSQFSQMLKCGIHISTVVRRL